MRRAKGRQRPQVRSDAALRAEAEAHLAFLRGTLIPDVRDSGADGMVETLSQSADLIEAFLRQKSA